MASEGLRNLSIIRHRGIVILQAREYVSICRMQCQHPPGDGRSRPSRPSTSSAAFFGTFLRVSARGSIRSDHSPSANAPVYPSVPSIRARSNASNTSASKAPRPNPARNVSAIRASYRNRIPPPPRLPQMAKRRIRKTVSDTSHPERIRLIKRIKPNYETISMLSI